MAPPHASSRILSPLAAKNSGSRLQSQNDNQASLSVKCGAAAQRTIQPMSHEAPAGPVPPREKRRR
jgi:hypothetical protein